MLGPRRLDLVVNKKRSCWILLAVLLSLYEGSDHESSEPEEVAFMVILTDWYQVERSANEAACLFSWYE